MKKIIYLFSALILLFVFCYSESHNSSDDTCVPVLLKKIIETDYNGDVFTTNYFYEGNKIVKTVDDDGYYEKFYYTGDLITKMEFYSDTDLLEQTDLFTYNVNQQLGSFQR